MPQPRRPGRSATGFPTRRTILPSFLPRLDTSVLVAIPAFGARHYTDAVLADLLDVDPEPLPNVRIIVVDNSGDYAPVRRDSRLQVHRPGSNLRWIGSANWALTEAQRAAHDVCVVLNNDTRLSPDFLYWLARSFDDCSDGAVAAPCYDDFWLHQRARAIPRTAAEYDGALAYRSVAFCDGTALAVSVAAARRLGPFDNRTFPRHGYGADIDLALRAREAGLRCIVTEAAYLHHERRGTMNGLAEETSERARGEIVGGMDAKWGPGWRGRAGLSESSFPAHNTGSAADWYA